MRRITGFFLDNLERYLKGEELRKRCEQATRFLVIRIYQSFTNPTWADDIYIRLFAHSYEFSEKETIMTTEWNKAETKDSVLTENTAQAVFKYLIDQESNRATMQTRWIWELLQNARDASIEGDNRLIAEVKYSPGELTFSHSGSGFKEKQIAHLIFHGSTKVEEEETIGQYGSGFLTTHLLSSEIDISGQLDDGQWFDFRLARKPDSVGALRESMDEAWENFNPTPYPKVPMSDPFTTRFVYPIVDDDAAEAVEKGIETLKQCAPFVVVFNQEFSGIDIKIPDETTRF